MKQDDEVNLEERIERLEKVFRKLFVYLTKLDEVKPLYIENLSENSCKNENCRCKDCPRKNETRFLKLDEALKLYSDMNESS